MYIVSMHMFHIHVFVPRTLQLDVCICQFQHHPSAPGTSSVAWVEGAEHKVMPAWKPQLPPCDKK